MKIFCTFFLCLANFWVFGQNIAFDVKDASKYGILIEELAYSYPNVADSSEIVFKDQKFDEFVKAYQFFLKKWTNFMKKNAFYWTKKTPCFQRIYVGTDGKIDYFIYDFLEGISEPDRQEFERLLNIFIKENKLNITSAVKFSQYSPTLYH